MEREQTKTKTEEETLTGVGEYVAQTETSRELFERACKYLPGGNTRDVLYHRPYPSYIESGSGCRVKDVDGNEFIDFMNNMTSLIHGHAPKGVVDRAVLAVRDSSAPGGPTPHEVQWAEHLCNRVDPVDLIRFTNSGTEATMHAIRAARAYTGNDVIAKFEGVYHGTHDDAQVSVHPPLHLAGPPEAPRSVPDSAGVPRSKEEEVLTLPYNDLEASLGLCESQLDSLAGMIIAPVMGSAVIPSTQEFIAGLREFTQEHDVPLIFDEVISFRLAYGGSHELFGVEPDLISFGKLIGGGFPVGAFGGHERIMRAYDPRGSNAVSHSGTFNANPVTASAGLAALERFDSNEVNRLNHMGDTLADGVEDILEDQGFVITLQQEGSLFNLYLTPGPIRNYRDIAGVNKDLEFRLYMELLDEGLRLPSKLMGALSTPMTDREVELFWEGLDTALGRLRPEFEAHAPQLLS